MRNKFTSRAIVAVVSLIPGVGASFMAQADLITLQVPDIPGDAAFAANNGLPPDSIRVLTVGNSVRLPPCDPGGGGGCGGKPIFGALSLVKQFGASSGPLFLSVVTGKFAPTAKIKFYRVRDGAATAYYTITLQDVLISSQQWQGNAAADQADSEMIEFAFSRISLRDHETGSRACYDLVTGETC